MQIQMGTPRFGPTHPMFGAFELRSPTLPNRISRLAPPKEPLVALSESPGKQGFRFSVAVEVTDFREIFFKMPGFESHETFYLTLSAKPDDKHQKLTAEVSYLRKEAVGEAKKASYRDVPGWETRREMKEVYHRPVLSYNARGYEVTGWGYTTYEPEETRVPVIRQEYAGLSTESIDYDRVYKSKITLGSRKDLPLLASLTKLVGKLPLSAEEQSLLQRHLGQVQNELQKPKASALPKAKWQETLDKKRDAILAPARDRYVREQTDEANQTNPAYHNLAFLQLVSAASRQD